MKNFKFNRTPIDIGVMKKHLFLKTLLVLTGILIGSVSTPMWADITVYVTGKIFIGTGNKAWDNSTSTIKVDVRYQGSEGNFYDSDTYKDQTMTNTGYTYNGYPIYSYTWTPSYGGGQYRFKHYKSGVWQEDYTTAWSTENGKIYDGYYSSAHQWITFGRDITIYAVPESMDGSKWDEGYTLKSIFKYGDRDSEKTDKITWERTEYTYDGNYIYTGSALMPYNVIKKIWFYYNDGSGDADLYECKPNGSDTQYGTNDIDGKIFLGWKDDCHKWVSYGRDVTVYTVPDYVFKDYATTFDEDTHYAAVCVQCGDGTTWKTTNMEKTAYTYDTYPIYTTTFVLDNNKFWEYQIKYFKISDDSQVGVYQFNNSEPKSEYGPSQIEDKIYRGWITSAHVFTPYAYDLELDQQVGSGGSSSVIVAEGSAMPAATMPSASGYTFGGYFTAVAGGGTKYYNANGSSAANWASRTITTLFAKFTQNITLNQNSATTSGTTSLAATYNAVLNASGITNPEKDYYDFGGWTNGSGGSGDVVINASKAVQTVASWTDGDKKWIHAGSSTLYAKWTEHPYTVTATASEGGSVGSASYTGKVVTTCAISATPNTGYKFSHWSVESGSATFDDQYSASTTMNATSDAEIKANFVYRWSIAGTWKIITPGEGDPYWDQDNYAMGNIGTNASSKDTCYVEITLPANTNYTFKVVDRSTSPYTWLCNNTATYYMTYGNSSNWTFKNDKDNTAACGITTAGAGTYKFAYNITDSKVTVTYPNSYTVTFGYGTGGSAVTATVEDATTISSGQYATAGKDITFTKTAANLAYTFKGWYNASSDGGAISCMASDDVYDDIAGNISVYAQFKTRYGLHGSLMDNNAGGMPGWAGDGADFTVVSYTDIGEGTGKGVALECSRTLEPNKQYKFRVQDRAAGSRWGLSESAVLPAEVPVNNVKLSTYGDVSSKDVYINTVGYGTYTFKITNMYDNGDGKYYPAIEVSRPASSQLTMGWKHYTNGTLSDGNTGGTVTAATNEGSGYDITNGQFYANGSNLTFTASPATGYHVEGWYSDANCSSLYTSGEGGATISGEGNVTLALASVSTNKTVYVKFTEDTKEAASGDGDWSAKVGDSKITDVVTISSTITVDVDHALAKRVILDQSGGKAGKLVITANKGLEVAEGIWVNKGSDPVAPTAEDLVLESSASGNATLIFNNSNSAAATVQMYSKSVIADENTWNWQYIGSPYVSASALHNYYGSYLYSWGNGDGTTTGWFAVPNGGSVEPFVAYCITNTTAGTYYQMEGTMVETDGNNQSISVPEGKNWVVGNSWTAPIQIGQLQDDDFTGLLKNVYLYNTGMDEKGEAEMVANPTGEARYAANTYVSIPIHAALYSGISVVSSLQGFYVKDDPEVDGGGTLKLNYTNHVRPSGGNSIQNGAMHAPKRIVADENEPNVLKIKVCGSKYDDRLVLLERADFSMGYDAGWDGDKMGNVAASPRITVEREDGTSDAVSAVPDLEGLAINFRAANTDNQQTLYFEYSDDIDPLYIVDVTNNEYTRVLTGNSYTFSTSDNEEHPRFILTRYGAPQVTTGVDEVYNANSARKQMINGTLYIIRDGRIYNAEGALVK